MLKVITKSHLKNGRISYKIKTRKSNLAEHLGTINLLMQNILKEDPRIKNEKELLKALKDFREEFNVEGEL